MLKYVSGLDFAKSLMKFLLRNPVGSWTKLANRTQSMVLYLYDVSLSKNLKTGLNLELQRTKEMSRRQKTDEREWHTTKYPKKIEITVK